MSKDRDREGAHANGEKGKKEEKEKEEEGNGNWMDQEEDGRSPITSFDVVGRAGFRLLPRLFLRVATLLGNGGGRPRQVAALGAAAAVVLIGLQNGEVVAAPG